MDKEKKIEFTINNEMTHVCPKCGWKSRNYSGEGAAGFTSTIEGAKGDWCLRCYVKKTTKGVPKMIKLTQNPQ